MKLKSRLCVILSLPFLFVCSARVKKQIFFKLFILNIICFSYTMQHFDHERNYLKNKTNSDFRIKLLQR